MTRRPPPPDRARLVGPLLVAAATIGLCGVIGIGHAMAPVARSAYTLPTLARSPAAATNTPAVTPSVAAQAPWMPPVRSVGRETVYEPPVTVWRHATAYLAGPTSTAWATTTATATVTSTATTTTTATATTTVTATATVTQTVAAPTTGVAP